jgi:hypothetical protein
MNSRHVEIRVGIDGVDVIADDWEVFDYLDDFFSERGLEFEFTGEEERDGQRVYVMHFGSDVAEERIAKALEGVSAEEVERIWNLNN